MSVTSGGSTTTASTTLIVNPVADQPGITATTAAAAIDEGHGSGLTLALSNAATLFEDGNDSVVITVTLSGGATLTRSGSGAAVIDNHDGTFTFTASSLADLAGLTITPPSEFEGTLTVGVSAVAHDGTSTSIAGTTSTTLTVNPVADQPVVTASTVAIDEGHSSGLTLGLSNASDLFENADDTVVITVTLSGGATLTRSGSGAAVIDNQDGSFTFTASSLADLAGLSITPPSEFEGAVTVGVSAVAHDGTSTSIAGTTSTTLTVNPLADQPVVTASTVAIDEGHSSGLTLGLSNAGDLFENADDTVVITVTLSGGATLTRSGSGAAVIDNHDGTFTFTATSLADLAGLTSRRRASSRAP